MPTGHQPHSKVHGSRKSEHLSFVMWFERCQRTSLCICCTPFYTGKTSPQQHAFREGSRSFRTNMDTTTSVKNATTLHSLKWASLWNAGLSVEAYANGSDEDLETVRVLNIHLQTCYYRLLIDFPDPGSANAVDRTDAATKRKYAIMDNVSLAAMTPWLAFMQPVPHPSPMMPTYELAGRHC